MGTGSALLLTATLVVGLWAALMPASTLAATTGGSNQPLAPSNYAVKPACGAVLPGQVRCLALRLVPQTAAARAHDHPVGMRTRKPVSDGRAAEGAYGLRPQDLHSGYELPDTAPGTQTIALVDAYNDPNAEADLKEYSKEFGLPECTKANGCFKKINQRGEEANLPAAEKEWSVEISLDIEAAHAVCQNCHILLVEAESPSGQALEIAEEEAVSQGADEISNSWGGGEAEGTPAAFNHPGVVITASAGDNGFDDWDENAFEEIGGEAAEFPASSPDVVSVGGTRLDLSEGHWAGETVWNDGTTAEEGENGGAGGGGCSDSLTAPAWQQAVPDWAEVGCGSKRAVADVSADADPYTPLAIYDSYRESGWQGVGGTSLASPIIASTFALAGGAHGVQYPAKTLYEHLGGPSLHDITSGSNGRCEKPFDETTDTAGCTATEEGAQCSEHRSCVAGPGYDGPSGVGTPKGLGAFQPSPPPVVTSVAPNGGSGLGGTVVTVTGEHLEGATAVDFGATPGTETDVHSATELTVKAPAHTAGAVDVTVQTPYGVSATVGGDRYTFQAPPPPSISLIEPGHGSTLGGEMVTITGSNFAGPTTVQFGGAASTEVSVRSQTELTARVPADSPAENTEVPVTVSTAGGASEATEAARFTYERPPAPVITNVSPSSGPATGGQRVTITGENLAGATSVLFGDSEVTGGTVVSATELIVTTPRHAAGTVEVQVSTPSGHSAAVPADAYTFDVVPDTQLPGGSESLTESPVAGASTRAGGSVGSSTAKANSNFALVAKRVNRRTGAITFQLVVFDRGSLSWAVSFKDGKFGSGAKVVGSAQIVSFTVVPSAGAHHALAAAARRHRSLAVTAHLTYTATGGAAVSHIASVGVRLRAKH